MSWLATEFPIKKLAGRSAFVAEVISWLRGTSYSTVFDGDRILEGDSVSLSASGGETLRLRAIDDDSGLQSIGFRHDFPDKDGRIWRTETVITRQPSLTNDTIRLRTQCLSSFPGVRLDVPKKPYLIKSLLSENWGGEDGYLKVSDKPVYLENNEDDLVLAKSIHQGEASTYLPIIYVSCVRAGVWLMSGTQLQKLAAQLGGIAHLVIEPSRKFSINLKDALEGGNVYGGTIGICLPKRGVYRRIYMDWRIPTSEDLLANVRQNAIWTRTQLPASGWDWTELQEQVLKSQRIRESHKLSSDDIEALYKEEVNNLKERIAELEAALIPQAEGIRSVSADRASLTDLDEPELYAGEIIDRVRFAVRNCIDRCDQDGLDARSKYIFEQIIGRVDPSPALLSLLGELTKATKNPSKMASEITAILSQHGYGKKSDNKHIKLEPREGFHGLDSITLAKTPSDTRGLANIRKQIERTLGLARLRK